MGHGKKTKLTAKGVVIFTVSVKRSSVLGFGTLVSTEKDKYRVVYIRLSFRIVETEVIYCF